MMDQKVLDFLAKEKVCVLSVCMPDGSCHSAAMHFSHQNEPLSVFIGTEKTTKKVQGLLNSEPVKASVVVGFDDAAMITVQMDGAVKMATSVELENIHKVHYTKHPGAEKYANSPDTCFLIFTPSWWRYSDYKTTPPTFIENK